MMTNLVLLPIGILAIATLQDISRREVSDAFPILIAVAGVLAISLGYWELYWYAAGLGSLVGLALTGPFFHFGILGGGDVKLLAALGIWFGPVVLVWILLLTALFGGLFALIAAIRGEKDLAYVPAITAGVLLHTSFPSMLSLVLGVSG